MSKVNINQILRRFTDYRPKPPQNSPLAQSEEERTDDSAKKDYERGSHMDYRARQRRQADLATQLKIVPKSEQKQRKEVPGSKFEGPIKTLVERYGIMGSIGHMTWGQWEKCRIEKKDGKIILYERDVLIAKEPDPE